MSESKALLLLQRKLDNHIEQEEERWGQLISAQEANTANIAQLTVSMKEIAESTAGVVKIYESFQGATRVGISAQNFAGWLVKWGVIGVAFAAGVDYIADRFKD